MPTILQENPSTNVLATDEVSDENPSDDMHLRRSHRQSKPPSRFCNMVTIGIQIGRMFSTDQTWDNLQPLKHLPEVVRIPLEQDMTSSSYLSHPEINKLKELYYLDSFDSDWDPCTEIEVVLRHRHTHYGRRSPGKHSYKLGTPIISKKDVRLEVQFFSGDKCWIPIEAARSDNPLPVIEYAKKKGLGKRPKWKWTMEFDIDSLHDLRKAFISKYENTPKYKF
jgi:hypothetical protein